MDHSKSRRAGGINSSSENARRTGARRWNGPPVDICPQRDGLTVDKCQQTNRQPGGNVTCSAIFTRIYSVIWPLYGCLPGFTSTYRFFSALFGVFSPTFGRISPGNGRNLTRPHVGLGEQSLPVTTPIRPTAAAPCASSDQATGAPIPAAGSGRYASRPQGSCLAAKRRRRARTGVYGICTGLYGFCTVLYGLCTVFGGKCRDFWTWEAGGGEPRTVELG